MKVLGIHDGHNATACLLEDGKVVFCLQEERLTNKKNFAGPPLLAIEQALQYGGISIDELDGIGVSSLMRYLGAKEYKDIVEELRHYSPVKELDPRLAWQRVRNLLGDNLRHTAPYQKLQHKKNIKQLSYLQQFGSVDWNKIRFYDHHYMHAVSTYYASGWANDSQEVLVLTLDGEGDTLCSTVWTGVSGKLQQVARTPAGNSLGLIYGAVTAFMGFVPLEHEYKLMGMAPHASPTRSQRCYEVFKSYLTLAPEGLVFKRLIPESIGDLKFIPRLQSDLAFERFDNICSGLQRFTEELVTQWVKNAIQHTGVHRVALSGGVFMNVKGNKSIAELPEVEQLYILPSCGDESNAIGAAYQMYVELCNKRNLSLRPQPLDNIYLGPDLSESEVESALAETGDRYIVSEPDDLEAEVARLLAEGQIVARVNGRLEFGARALGNRSILGDPTRLECLSTINQQIKKRDFWMPFAPVVSIERANEYMVIPKYIYSPFMMMSYDTVPERRSEFKAAMHQADYTARPQILSQDENPSYYKILKKFEELTGRGILLNTSYNLHGYPIACGAKEAIWVMDNSGLKYLALGRKLIRRRE